MVTRLASVSKHAIERHAGGGRLARERAVQPMEDDQAAMYDLRGEMNEVQRETAYLSSTVGRAFP